MRRIIKFSLIVVGMFMMASCGGGDDFVAQLDAPEVMVTNSSSENFSSVKVGPVEYTSIPGPGSNSSTGFLVLPIDNHAIKVTPTSTGTEIPAGPDDIGPLVFNSFYSVQIKDDPVVGYCATLWLLSDPNLSFDNDKGKIQLNSTSTSCP